MAGSHPSDSGSHRLFHLIRDNATRFTPEALIVSAPPSSPFAGAVKQDDIFLLDTDNELSYGFSRADQKRRQLIFDDFNTSPVFQIQRQQSKTVKTVISFFYIDSITQK